MKYQVAGVVLGLLLGALLVWWCWEPWDPNLSTRRQEERCHVLCCTTDSPEECITCWQALGHEATGNVVAP